VAARGKSSDQDAGLLAAAQAAASWARARRATWTSAPLEVASARSTVEAVQDDEFEPDYEMVSTAEPAESVHPRGSSIPRWLPYAAALVVLAGVGYVGWPYAANLFSSSATEKPGSKPAADPKATSATTAAATSRGGARGRGGATATLTLKSNPVAQVLIDGKPRGTTPVTLTDVTPGKHEVTLKADVGSVRKTITIAANEKSEIEESIFSGFAVVYTPFEVTISEGGKQLRPDDRNQIMLAAGLHDLRLTSRALSYDVVKQVEVKPGETTTLRLTPTSPLTVTGTEAMEVWLDGTRVGQTPVNALQVAVGVHEVLVKKATGAERKYSITVGGNPVTLNADF
jgi:PEGA domain